MLAGNDRVFTTASDAAVVSLIENAKRRLLVIAPALSLAVARALSARFGEVEHLDLRVILDADPEVYRLGYGEREALEVIHDAAVMNHLDLRMQPGVRIGVIISDGTTMVFAPVSRNIEAGSETDDKPNAILISGSSADSLLRAAGAQLDNEGLSGEIGNAALDPAKVKSMQADLDRNPPAKFDIARKLQVFSSRVVYVEFEITGFALSRKQVPLPDDLNIVNNKNLQTQITSRLRAPMAEVGAVDIIVGEGQDARLTSVDDAWLRAERKRIEDHYTFQIDNFGRVILREDRKDFDAAVKSFLIVMERYHLKVREALDNHRTAFCENFVAEFLPRWKDSPPEYMTRWGTRPDESALKEELERRANEVFENMLSFEPPSFRLIEKNVSPANVDDPEFLNKLLSIMQRRRVPKHIIDSLFASGAAAPEQGRLLSRY
jgi:hypothetical protein